MTEINFTHDKEEWLDLILHGSDNSSDTQDVLAVTEFDVEPYGYALRRGAVIDNDFYIMSLLVIDDLSELPKDYILYLANKYEIEEDTGTRIVYRITGTQLSTPATGIPYEEFLDDFREVPAGTHILGTYDGLKERINTAPDCVTPIFYAQPFEDRYTIRKSYFYNDMVYGYNPL